MKWNNNEKGYTLIIVLLTITLIGVFSVTLLTNVLNSSVQNRKTEEKIQLTNLTEMGTIYYRTLVESIVPTLPSDTDEAIALLHQELPNMDSPSTRNPTYYYKIETANIKKIGNKKIEIIYRSIGFVSDYRMEKSEKITLSKNGSGSFDFGNINPKGASYQQIDWNKSHYLDDTSYNKNVNFLSEVRINPTVNLVINGNIVANQGLYMPSNGLFKVNGHFYYRGGDLFLNQESRLEIAGDALFETVSLQGNSIKNGASICVHGKIHKPENLFPLTVEKTSETSCKHLGEGVWELNKNSNGDGNSYWEIIGSTSLD
ncbi:type II secretion system protein [Bacillus sp. V5-8f]|uniref:type II secretion system protein n=1 Tax=Bacillus sp. V5-8f TaxID=2053044 RepID=UPI000C77066E|nr:type II secretion system protein [Bacillus sp. V5-8f]PLT32385.1 hypothetical protein CUU64_20030 [Bacillus sp. V5-8f]